MMWTDYARARAISRTISRTIYGTLLLMMILAAAAPDAAAQRTFIALHGGVVFGEEEGFYADDPFNAWYDRETSGVFGLQIYRQLSPGFMVGVYSEYEMINFADFDNGSRYGFGLAFVGRYPDDLTSGIGFEMGGTFGPAFASSGDLDAQNGVDFSVFIGPVIQVIPGFQVAVHGQGLYGWYGGGDVPEAVQNAQPRLRLTLYYEW